MKTPASSLALCALALALAGCGGGEDRQPSEAELEAYYNQMERDEAASKANKIRAARGREKARDDDHRRRMDALPPREQAGSR